LTDHNHLPRKIQPMAVHRFVALSD